MNVNRHSPYRLVDTLSMPWMVNGRFAIIKYHFDLGIIK